MDREEVLKLLGDANNGSIRDPLSVLMIYEDELIRFAALIAAAERERCAKVCDQMPTFVNSRNGITRADSIQCAAAIRALT